MRRKRLWLAGLLLLGLVLSLPLLLNLEVFRQSVHRAVERQLGRRVEFASLTARLLPWPVIVGRGVMVFEQEGFGAEPFLYADEVHCHLSSRILRSGRLEFSEIYFLRPSLNLVRNPAGDWNVGSFLLAPSPGGSGRARPPGILPVVSATEGRINFKFGANKQVYSLVDARLRGEPLPGGRWRLYLEATPVRGDRRLTETGTLRVQGELGRARDYAALPFRFQVGWERGSLAQLMALVTGREPSWRARSLFAATLEGTPAAWTAQGRLVLDDVHHRDLVASARSPRWQADFEVRALERSQVVEVRQLILHTRRSELRLTGRVEEVFRQPRWSLAVESDRIVLDELLAQWTGLQAAASDDARLDGAVELALTARGPWRDWHGELASTERILLRAPGLSRGVEIPELRLRLQRGRLELVPLVVRLAPGSDLQLEGDWRLAAPGAPYRLAWRSAGADLAALQQATAAFGWDILGPARWQGRAGLAVEWRGGQENPTPRWEGTSELRGVRFHPPEFNRPVEILEARLEWKRGVLQVAPLVAQLGENPVTGSLRREAGDWTVDFSAGELRLGDLDALLNPAREGLLARLVGAGPRPAARWQQWSAVGQVRIEDFEAGPFRLRKLQAEGRWQAGRLDLTRLRCRGYGGRFDGRLQGDFVAAPPAYRLAGNVKQVELNSLLAGTTELGPLFRGLAGADVALQTSGLRSDELRKNLQGRVVGVLHDAEMANLDLLAAMAEAAGEESSRPEAPARTALQSLAGEFLLGDEQVELDAVHLIVDGAAMELTGRVKFGGDLDLRLTGAPLLVAGRPASPATTRLLNSAYRVTGSLRRPQVELAAAASAEARP